jgi:hypothetical protein
MSKASTVRDICETLPVADEVNRQSLADLAEAYDQAVRDFYSRLNRCREAAQAGHDEEARRVATEPISLEQEYDLLNFDGLADWLDVCVRRNLSIPPLLDAARVGEVTGRADAGRAEGQATDTESSDDAADAVNLADFDEKPSARSAQPLDADTQERQSRLQSARRRLAQLKARSAPVADRLAALREVVELAGDDDQARQELSELEAIRLDELEAEVARAENAGDIEQLQALAKRIKKGPWIQRSPEGLLGNLAEVLRSGKQRMAQRRYAEIAGELEAAMAEGKIEGVKHLLAEAEKVNWKLGVAPDARTNQALERAQQWVIAAQSRLEKKRRFDKARRKLQDALSNRATPREHLESLFEAVERLDEQIPATLRHRYERRLERLRRNERKRKWMSIAAGAVCLLIIGSVVGYGVWTHRRGQEAGQWRGRIEKALDEGDLEQAGQLAEALRAESAEIYRSEHLRDVLARLSRRLEAEKKRAQRFDALMAQARKPGFIEDPSRDAAILEEASRLARTPEERVRLEEIRRAVEARDQAAHSRRLEVFEREMRELTAARDAAAEAATADADNLPALAQRALALARPLLSDQRLTSEDREPVRRIVEDIRTLQRRYEQRRTLSEQVATYLMQLHAASWNVELYCRTLETFLDRYPQAAEARALKQVTRHMPLWRAEANWQSLSESWDSVLGLSSPGSIQRRRRAVAAFQSAYKAHLHGPFLTRYEAYLARGAQAWTDDGPAGMSELKELLQRPAILQATMVKTTDGRRFYLHKSAPKTVTINDRPVGYRLTYLTGLDGKTDTTTIEIDEMAGEPTRAPHSVLAEKINKALTVGDAADNWAVLYLSLADIVRRAEQADPVFRARLMRMLLASAQSASLAPRDNLRRVLKGLQQENWDSDWLDPTDSQADKQRAKAQAVLGDVPELDSLIAEARETLSALRESMTRYSSVAVALPEGVKLTGDVQAGDVLYVLRLGADEKPRIAEVGRIDRQGRAVIDPAARLEHGMLLFTRDRPLQLR